MLIPGLIILIVMIGWLFSIAKDHEKEAVMFICVFGFLLCAIALIGAIFNPFEVNAKLAKFEAVKISYEATKTNGMGLDDVQIQRDIIDQNKWLASQKYWSSTFWGLWILDEVDDAEYIR